MRKRLIGQGIIFCFFVALVLLGGCFFVNTPSLDGVEIYEGFALTRSAYAETADLDQAVRAEFGFGARVADWNEVVALFENQCAEFLDGVGLDYVGATALVYKGGTQYWSGNRHYFISRHNGETPGSFLVHADIANNTLDLGSWYDLHMPVLVRVP